MKPTILISRCLGFARCRHDGGRINFTLVDLLKEYVDFITVCPEVEMGLPTPRESLRLVQINDKVHLMQPKTEEDLTAVMDDYAHKKLTDLPRVHGCILKSRSPSCAIKDAKIYSGLEKAPVLEKGAGLFAQHLQRARPHLALEEEGRLTNLRIREHFFSRIFMLARFDEVKQSGEMKQLVALHADNKYLFFAYNQHQKNLLGRIVANHAQLSFDDVCAQYEQTLSALLAKMPSVRNYINAFEHIFGYFSKHLSAQERSYFKELLAQYRSGQLERSAIASLLKSYAIAHQQEYILSQTIFEPFPKGLVTLADTGKTSLLGA
ncbi:DUF523 and DUF1722 domain-containing protein [Pasteurellaceae bacterium TAE3-ERU1]|nr:DUF523 and DUF1722 domain-containing protein [Pasteurellaceae bacterium TAE3-ERU1]